MKVLVATEKPFAAAAVDGIKKEIEGAGNELVLLEKYTEKAQLLDAVKDVDAMIIRSDKADAEVLDAAKNLKIIVRAGAGYDNIDLAAATAHNVVAENTPGQNSNAVAELVFGLLVFTVRNFYNGKAGSELKGKKLGILAFGNVGRNVARIAKGFGMKPLHDCVDNAIHTYAGVQLRQACFELILEQGYEEPVGMAKITPAYNLPSAFVIHTVGPKIVDQPTQIDEDLLAKSYLSVLALAEKNNIESIAIPCLSTGDFNFPKQKAAKIAIQTVKTFIDESSIIKKVIFNVFDDENLAIYQKLLAES